MDLDEMIDDCKNKRNSDNNFQNPIREDVVLCHAKRVALDNCEYCSYERGNYVCQREQALRYEKTK